MRVGGDCGSLGSWKPSAGLDGEGKGGPRIGDGEVITYV